MHLPACVLFIYFPDDAANTIALAVKGQNAWGVEGGWWAFVFTKRSERFLLKVRMSGGPRTHPSPPTYPASSLRVGRGLRRTLTAGSRRLAHPGQHGGTRGQIHSYATTRTHIRTHIHTHARTHARTHTQTHTHTHTDA